jgi:hypothetical protein
LRVFAKWGNDSMIQQFPPVPSQRRWLVLALLALLAHLPLGVEGAGVLVRSSAAFLLLVAVPGLLLAGWLIGSQSTEEWLVYGVGLGFGLATALVLLASLLPGPVTPAHLLFGLDGLSVGLLALNWLRPRPAAGSANQRCPRFCAAATALILLAAAGVRLANLGYSQIQGDEASALVRAASLIQDHPDAIFFQPRGPLDTAIPAGMLVLSGAKTELALRLPFALAGLLAVLAVVQLGRALAGWPVGLLAGTGLALDGYATAFSRMMHYESVVLLTTTAAVLALYRIWALPPTERAAARPLFWVAALLAATALLAHYDGAVVLIAGGYLLFTRQRSGLYTHLRAGALPLAVALGGTGIFYVAFVLHPNFSATVGGYSQSLLDESRWLVDNLLIYAERTAFYSGTVQLSLLAAGIWGLASVALWRGPRWGGVRWLGLWALATPLFLVAAPALPLGSTALWAAALGLALLLTPTLPTAERLLWVWFGVPCFAALFLTARPGLHFYIFSPPLALLLGWGTVRLHRFLSHQSCARLAQPVLAATLLVVAAAGGTHLYQLFVSTEEQAMRAKAAQTPPWLWPADTFTTPILYFGIPYDAGWRTIGAWYDQGRLQGSYQTNIDRWISDWYTVGAEYCKSAPDYVILDPFSQPGSAARLEAELGGGYTLEAFTARAGEPRLLVYSRTPGHDPEGFDLDPSVALLDLPVKRAPLPITPWSGTAPLTPADYRFGETLALRGLRVDFSQSSVGGQTASVAAGDFLSISLDWQLLAQSSRTYTVFLQLIDANAHKAGQRDTQLACNNGPTDAWRAGKKALGYYRLPVAADAPSGTYMLVAGVYDAQTQERLPVYDHEGTLLGDVLPLQQVHIQSAMDR